MSAVHPVLAASPWLARLPPEALIELSEQARDGSVAARSVLFRAGDPCPGMYLVLEGLVRIIRHNAAGDELLLRTIGAGGTFLEVAILAGLACPAQAESIGACRWLLIPSHALHAVLERHPDAAAPLLADIARRLPRLIDRLEDVTLHDAVGRVARHLLRAGEEAFWDDRGGPWRETAARLDLTPESVSRALRHLVALGALRQNLNGTYLIADAGRLRLTAESR